MTTKGTKRRRRKTPGVSILKPQEGSRTGWRIQFKDPDPKHGDKLWRETIPSAWAATEKTRIDYAARKCAELERERRRLAEGGTPNQHKPVEEAIREWVGTYPAERTRESYGASVGLFAVWAGEPLVSPPRSLPDERERVARRVEMLVPSEIEGRVGTPPV